jgi:hypothetical protein
VSRLNTSAGYRMRVKVALLDHICRYVTYFDKKVTYIEGVDYPEITEFDKPAEVPRHLG